MPHVLLHSAFSNVHAQLEQFAPDALCSPEPILYRHFIDQRHGLCGDLWFGSCCSGFVLPEEPISLAMPAQERLWLDNEKRLLPGPNYPGQKHQKHPIRFGICRSFHVSAEDDELLAQKCIFCHEFGLASAKVRQRPRYESGVRWFGPVDEAVVERLKAHACQTRDEGENPMHSVRYPFTKMSR